MFTQTNLPDVELATVCSIYKYPIWNFILRSFVANILPKLMLLLNEVLWTSLFKKITIIPWALRNKLSYTSSFCYQDYQFVDDASSC